MGKKKKKPSMYDTANTYNAGAYDTANQIPEKTTATAQYLAPRALDRIKELDTQGSGGLKAYELFDPEQFAERESQRRTGIETLNAPLVNPNYLAGLSEQMKDERMRDRANSTLGAYQNARQRAIGEAYTAEGDTRNALATQLQGRLGAASNQTQLAQAHNQRRRWFDTLIGLAGAGAKVASGLGGLGGGGGYGGGYGGGGGP